MQKKTYSGKLIVLEGIDGSGKATQAKLLADTLEKNGYKVKKLDFPQYNQRSAGLVSEYLAGKYGTAEEVGPYRASIFYACDRYDASFKIAKWLREGKIVIADRYMASNIGHQGGKIKNKKERKNFLRWLYNLEYNIFKIPKPTFTVILKTSPQLALKMALSLTDKAKIKKRKQYLGNKGKDEHEHRNHLSNALRSYLEVAKEFPKEFRVIECLRKDQLLPSETVHQRVWEVIRKIL